METKNYNEFNRIEYLKNFITKFLQSNSKVRNEIEGTLALLDRAPDTFENREKKKIIERLDALLSNPNFLELVQKEKEEREISELSNTTGEQRITALKKISELAELLTYRLSESIFSDCDRHYNMANIPSNGMIASTKQPDGSKKKDITYIPKPTISKSISDFSGITISIQNIGSLKYKSGPFIDDYISAFRVSKYDGDKMIMEPKILFSNISMINLDEPDYKNTVANTLLSDNNIDLSHVNGYIGELDMIVNSNLKDGEEKFDPGFYTYKIPCSQYSLTFDGEKIEAVRAYKEEVEKEKSNKQNKDSGR